jgi:hypothetical protein
LDRLERQILPNNGANEGNKHGDHVDGEVDSEEAADIVADAASPFERVDDGVKVVVNDNDENSFVE